MPTEYLDINLGFDIDENWCEARVSYDYVLGEPASWDDPGSPTEATNVIIEFRHNAPKGKPEFDWAPNPFLEQLVDTERLRAWLVRSYEDAAEDYYYSSAAE